MQETTITCALAGGPFGASTRLPPRDRQAFDVARLRAGFLVIGLAFVTVLAGAGSGLSPAGAQLVQSRVDRADANEVQAPAADPLGRGTPRGTVGGFLAALAGTDYDRAADYLDLSQIPVGQRQARGRALAETLQALLDRGGWLNSPSSLRADLAGDLTDRLGEDQDVIGGVLTSNGIVDITATHVARSDGPALWLVSQQSLQALPSLIATTRPSILDRFLWTGLKSRTILGAPIGHWIALAFLSLIALGVGWMLTASVRIVAGKFALFRRSGQAVAVSDAVLMPIGLIVAVFVTQLSAFGLGMSVVARQYGGRIGNIVLWFAAAWLLWRAIDVFVEMSRQRAIRKGHVGAISAVTLAGRTIKIALVALAFFAVLSNFGFDVTTGLAALGIGGLALALGAQKTIENLVGSMTLVADHPVRIGDFCRIGTVFGTVEDIGMRSTKLRTLDRTILTVPNGELATLQIENFTQRDRFWLHHEFALRLDTPPGRMRTLLKDMRALLEIDPRLDPESNRVRILRADRDAMVVELFAYAFATDFNDFLGTQEDILFRIFETMHENGVALALPTQTLNLDPGLAAHLAFAALPAAAGELAGTDPSDAATSPSTAGATATAIPATDPAPLALQASQETTPAASSDPGEADRQASDQRAPKAQGDAVRRRRANR